MVQPCAALPSPNGLCRDSWENAAEKSHPYSLILPDTFIPLVFTLLWGSFSIETLAQQFAGKNAHGSQVGNFLYDVIVSDGMCGVKGVNTTPGAWGRDLWPVLCRRSV